MCYVGEKSVPCWPFVPIDKPRQPYRSKLSEAQRKTEAARKPGGEENALYELAAAMLLERSISLRAVCECCSFEWESVGLSDPLWEGSAYVADTGLEAPRALLLSCPECAEYANAERFIPSMK